MAYTIVPAGGTGNQIVQLDVTPPTRLTAGQGGNQRLVTLLGSATVPINMPTTDFLPLVRIPTNSMVKRVLLALDAAPSTSLTGSLGLCFSDGGSGQGGDGTPQSLQSVYALTGAVPAIVSQSFFLQATNITTYVGKWTDVTFANYANSGSATDGFYIPSAANKVLWSALTTGAGAATSGSSPSAFTSCQSEPFGFFDITWFETTTGVNTGALTMTVMVEFSGEAT